MYVLKCKKKRLYEYLKNKAKNLFRNFNQDIDPAKQIKRSDIILIGKSERMYQISCDAVVLKKQHENRIRNVNWWNWLEKFRNYKIWKAVVIMFEIAGTVSKSTSRSQQQINSWIKHTQKWFSCNEYYESIEK